MKEMLEKFKKSKSSLALVILALVLIIAGISFALFSPSINLLGRRNIKISKCELDINFKESDELMLVSKYPIKDSEALKYKAKDVVITNNSTCDTAYYKLTIKDLNNSSINKNKIKFQLIDNTSGNTTNGNNPDTFLVEDSLNNGDSKSYEIRLWIDESATNSDIYVNGDVTKPIEYKYTLNIEASDEEIRANGMTASEFALANVGQNGLEEVTHEIDDTLQVDSKFATEYRYRGSDVNNYVYFNCSSFEQSDSTCEIWRIIGVIPTEDENGKVENRFKIMQGYTITDYTEYIPNNSSLDTDLNDGYYNYLSSFSRDMIGMTKYYLGGPAAVCLAGSDHSDCSSISISEIWAHERKKVNDSSCVHGNSSTSSGEEGLCYFYDDSKTSYTNRIALMYVSDYIYGLDKNYDDDVTLYGSVLSDNSSYNWIDASNSLFTIDPYPYYKSTTLMISGYSMLWNSSVEGYGALPVLSLLSKVRIVDGDGTSTNPYQLSM